MTIRIIGSLFEAGERRRLRVPAAVRLAHFDDAAVAALSAPSRAENVARTCRVDDDARLCPRKAAPAVPTCSTRI